MIQLMWGEALAAIAKKKADGSYDAFQKLPKCVENALQLNTTKGEKKEAKVEGGGIEAVKYNANAYSLAMSFRRGRVDGKCALSPLMTMKWTVWLMAFTISASSRKIRLPVVFQSRRW